MLKTASPVRVPSIIAGQPHDLGALLVCDIIKLVVLVNAITRHKLIFGHEYKSPASVFIFGVYVSRGIKG